MVRLVDDYSFMVRFVDDYSFMVKLVDDYSSMQATYSLSPLVNHSHLSAASPFRASLSLCHCSILSSPSVTIAAVLLSRARLQMSMYKWVTMFYVLSVRADSDCIVLRFLTTINYLINTPWLYCRHQHGQFYTVDINVDN